MADAFVYSGVTATIWNLDYYGCPPGPNLHTIVGGSSYCCPIDIGGGLGDGTDMIFRGSSNIQSIKVVHIGNVCANTGLTPWTYGIKLHLYKQPNAVCKMGTVLYGHLKNRAGNGTVINKGAGSWAQYLGELPADCACGCSNGIHIHMECYLGIRNPNLVCNQPITAGLTYLYKFTLPDSC